MYKITLTLIFVITLLTLPFFASVKAAEKIEVEVQGMVCDFCAQGLQKTIGALDEVDKINVDMDSQKVSIFLKDDKDLADEKIKELIVGNGFSVVDIVHKQCTSKETETTEC